MLVGQKLGPFLIEMELGAGAMGAVYKGRYVKTGAAVAIKVMSHGTSNASSIARFEREANILKQLNHPNIVRYYGASRHGDLPYYAMEYVKGETLDKVMERRDRFSWEEVVALGLQLCAALQHAHDKGIVHRDLKPSNLMILSDGTLKLTDFGIAKDLDVTALTAANNTVGTASYMSPEQCKGTASITYKSDLYSLGVVFYELVTGKRPFVSETAMELFMMHVHGAFVRPSKIVLDLPVWMDDLVCRLLEKKPEDRPLSADVVARELSGIQDKVEAQQAAGVDAAKVRLLDVPREKRAVSDEDRDAARALAGKKGRRKPKKAGKRWWVKVGIPAVGLSLGLAAVIALIVYATRPPSPDALFKRAERMMNAGKIDEARDGPIKEYIDRYGSLEGPQTEQMRKWLEEYEVARYEKLFGRHLRHVKEGRGLRVEAQTEAQGAAFEAVVAEHDGDRAKAEKLWKAVADHEGSSGLGVVARRHLEALAAIDGQGQRLAALRAEARGSRKEPELSEEEQLAFLAYRQELLGDLAGARRRCEQLRLSAKGRNDQLMEEAGAEKDAAKRSEAMREAAKQRAWQVYAAAKSRELADALKASPQEDKARVELVGKAVAEARGLRSRLDARQVARDVVAAYDSDPEFAGPVKEARALIAEVDGPPKR
jgi:predicted Ser/Thr protein kinase